MPLRGTRCAGDGALVQEAPAAGRHDVPALHRAGTFTACGVPGASALGKPHEVPRRLRSRRRTAAISRPQAGAEEASTGLEAAARKERRDETPPRCVSWGPAARRAARPRARTRAASPRGPGTSSTERECARVGGLGHPLAAPTGQVWHQHVLAQVQLWLVQDEPPTGPALSSYEGQYQRAAQERCRDRVRPRRTRTDVQHATENLPDPVVGQRLQVRVGGRFAFHDFPMFPDARLQFDVGDGPPSRGGSRCRGFEALDDEGPGQAAGDAVVPRRTGENCFEVLIPRASFSSIFETRQGWRRRGPPGPAGPGWGPGRSGPAADSNCPEGPGTVRPAEARPRPG